MTRTKRCTKRSTQSLTLAEYSRLRRSSNKYKAVRTDGFASKKEAARYQELLLLERAGKITNLTTQVKFSLDIEGVHICNYFADACYDDEQGNVVVEDTKSPATRTPVYQLKKKLMLALYKISLLET
jgi:hypothetical protein